MTGLRKQIHTSQRRLWANRWLQRFAWSLVVAAATFSAVVVIQRLYDLSIPLFGVGTVLVAAAWVFSIIATFVGRESASVAAAALDQAAGLKERLSTAHYFDDTSDPFVEAVQVDAEQVSRSLSARQHIRIVIPSSYGWSAVAMVVAACAFLVPRGSMVPAPDESADEHVQAKQASIAVKRKLDEVRKLVENTPVPEELKDILATPDKLSGGQLKHPDSIRHEAVKKIDKLADAVKQQRKKGKYDAMRSMRRMMRGLKVPKSSNTATEKLVKALARGDFKTAKQQLNAMREQLATLKTDEDKELVEKMSRQLESLAKQLDKLGDEKKLAQKLAKLNLDPEQMKRLLASLKKKDLDQITRQLMEKGLDLEKAKKLAKQLKQQQQSGSMAKQLAQAMKQASMAGAPGQMGEAMAGLQLAAEQLGDLELMDQELSQMEATLVDLQNAKNDLGRACSSCNGQGCSRCGGNQPGKGGMGRKGRGRGNLAPEEKTAVNFKMQRGKVRTGRGAIIGQYLFEGKQVKGEVSTEYAIVVAAAERDASDRINRSRVPRQYHKAVKHYFSNVHRSLDDADVAPSNTKVSDDPPTADLPKP